jgi:cytochrome c
MRYRLAHAGLMLAAFAIAGAPGAARADDPAGNAEAGKHLYKTICTACHSNVKGKNGAVGPSLYGAYGAKAGQRPGFHYSDALKNSGLTWDTPTLLKWEAGARDFVPGTKMTYPGLKNPQDRADIIAYLQTLHD